MSPLTATISTPEVSDLSLYELWRDGKIILVSSEYPGGEIRGGDTVITRKWKTQGGSGVGKQHY